MASVTLSLLVVVVFAGVVHNSDAAAASTKATIQSGKSQTISCPKTGEVLSVIESIYTLQTPKKTSSTPGAATPCNSDTSNRNTIRRQCNKKATCTINANDNVLQSDDKSCTTKRPLIVEYTCAAPGASNKSTDKGPVRAMVNELV